MQNNKSVPKLGLQVIEITGFLFLYTAIKYIYIYNKAIYIIKFYFISGELSEKTNNYKNPPQRNQGGTYIYNNVYVLLNIYLI